MSIFEGKKVVLGVTGCIAAYKAVEITRELVKSGADVKVIMTEAAAHFVTPLTFRTLSRNPVATRLFGEQKEEEVPHISLAREADVLLIAPATANVLAKAAHGIADDLLTTTILACRNPVIFAPAMNKTMYLNPATQKSIAILRKYGHKIIQPGEGELACGEEGTGRLAEVDRILENLRNIFEESHQLSGVKILVSAGGTREPIDPVRFIGNKSSGRMGYALAETAAARGAEVILVSAPTDLTVPKGVEYVPVTTVGQMREAIMERFARIDVAIKAAAVSDFKVSKIPREKIKKQDRLILELVRTPDILAELGKVKKDQILVGFAAETEDLVANAKKKLKAKNLDMVVANDVSREDTGIGKETNQVVIIGRMGSIRELPNMPKQEVARTILDEVVLLLKEKAD